MPRRHFASFPSWQGTQGSFRLYQCPACGTGFTLQSYETGPAGKAAGANKVPGRGRLVKCGGCRRGLSCYIPPPFHRDVTPKLCKRQYRQPGTLPALSIPRPAPEAVLFNRVSKREIGKYRPYLQSGLLYAPDQLGMLRNGLSRFPVKPLVEQLAFFVKLGFKAVPAVLATLASEKAYIYAMPPATMVLEQLIAVLTSVMLPPMARPLPDAWRFDAPDRRGGVVSFPAARGWYAWARVEPLPDVLKGVCLDRLRRLVAHSVDENSLLAPAIRRSLRPLRVEDYRFVAGELPKHRATQLALCCWEACNPGVRIDYEDHYQAGKGLGHFLEL